MIRDLVVRTYSISAIRHHPYGREFHTLCHIKVCSRKAIGSKESCVHIHTMLPTISTVVAWAEAKPTESSTPPKALISASILSFLDWSCANVKPLVCVPFVFADPEVGPERTVGACRFSILNGSPISFGGSGEGTTRQTSRHLSLVLPGFKETRSFGGVGCSSMTKLHVNHYLLEHDLRPTPH